MARNTKRSDLKKEEILAKFAKNWKKASDLNEIKIRAEEGSDAFRRSHDRSLNAIWNLFYKYPEAFLYQKIIYDRIIDAYMADHISLSGHADVQEENMRMAIVKMRDIAEEMYSDMVKVVDGVPVAIVQTQTNDVKKVGEKKEDNTKLNDNSHPSGLIGKRVGKTFRISDSISEKFKEDITPIGEFKPESGTKLITYLRKQGITYLYQFFEKYQDKKWRHSLYQKSYFWAREYDEFKENLIKYIKENDDEIVKSKPAKRADKKSSVKPAKKSESSKLNDKIVGATQANTNSEVSERKATSNSVLMKMPKEISKIEDIKMIDASNFVKDSPSMAKISKLVENLLNKLTNEYLDAGLTADEVSVEIDNEIVHFRKIVDAKRAELERKKVASFIRVKISDGVKYKYKQPKPRVHVHGYNTFVQDDLDI